MEKRDYILDAIKKLALLLDKIFKTLKQTEITPSNYQQALMLLDEQMKMDSMGLLKLDDIAFIDELNRVENMSLENMIVVGDIYAHIGQELKELDLPIGQEFLNKQQLIKAFVGQQTKVALFVDFSK